MREGRADSTRTALESIRDGLALLTRAEIAPSPGAGTTLERLDELSAQLRQQGKGVVQLLQALDHRDAEIAGALRTLVEAQRVQAEAFDALCQEVRVSTAHSALASPSAPKRGVVKRVLGAVFDFQ